MTRITKRPVVRGYASETTIQTTVSAPTKGLDAQNNLIDMPADSAIELDNFICRPYGCETRKGSQKYVTGISGYVESLMPYNAVNPSNDKLFACAGQSIYDCTAQTSTPAAVVTGLSNAQWESTNFTTPGGQFLVACNGSDAPRMFNGSSWVTWSQVATPSSPGQVSGVDPATFSNVSVHQMRLWFTQKGSTAAWYLPIQSVGGVAQKFDFGPYLKRGGSIVALSSWTVDAGTGMNDKLVAVSSEGDVLIYEGTDPSSSASWGLAGVWQLGTPIGKRCLMKLGGDVLYLSSDGLMPVSLYLQSDRLNQTQAITTRIQQTISEATALSGSINGWQSIVHPVENLVILNVPQSDPSQNYQLVYNTVTDGWSSFSGWSAFCFAMQRDVMFFGTNGGVNQAFVGWTDSADFTGNNGTKYRATAQQAFNYFGKPGQKKHYKLVRVNSASSLAPQIAVGLNTDFVIGVTPAAIATYTTPQTVWGGASWGSASWSPAQQAVKSWQVVSGIGYAASLTVSIEVVGKTTWSATDWVLEVGGVI